MSRLEQLEQQVAELDASELKALRAWFERYDAEVWDRQFESDAKSGKLGRLTSGRASDSCRARFSVRQTSHLSFSNTIRDIPLFSSRSSIWSGLHGSDCITALFLSR